MTEVDKSFRLLDFNIYDDTIEKETSSSGSDNGEYQSKTDIKNFVIQMFGINETGQTICLYVNDYKPFFYIMVGNDWGFDKKNEFLSHIKTKIGKYYESSICECKIIKRKKLYGFDGGMEHKFIMLKFNNTSAMNKVKNLYYVNGKTGRRLLEDGYKFQDTKTYLYEANIPPLLRYFHIKEISPSGWISIPLKRATRATLHKTSCTYEYTISNKDIVPLNNKETRVPYKICSFDIEASSSHGDFPVPVKSYKKLAGSIMEYYDANNGEITKGELIKIIKTAFGYDNVDNVDKVYPKRKPSMSDLNSLIEVMFKQQIKELYQHNNNNNNENTIESLFEKIQLCEEEDDGDICEMGKLTNKMNMDTNVSLIGCITLVPGFLMELQMKKLQIQKMLQKLGY